MVTVSLDIDTTIHLTLISSGTHSAFAGNSLKIYPNPTKGLVHMITGTSEAYIQLYSPPGRLLIEKEVYSMEAELDLSAYPSVCYMVRVRTREHSFIRKVIKE